MTHDPTPSLPATDARVDADLDADLADLADSNLVASYRAHLAWQAPCDSLDDGAVFAVAGANRFPGPYKNVVLRLDPALPPAELLVRADAFFGPRGRSYAVAVRSRVDADLEAHLLAAGHALKAESPCMVIEAPVPVRAVDDRVRLARLATPDDVREAVALSAEAYATLGLPVEEAHAMLARAGGWLESDVAGFIARIDGRPAAMALTLFSEGAAGVYWVATLPEARGRGLGEVCAALATNAGFARGARVVTLQASPMGEPIYTRLGYRTVDRLRRYRPA